MRLVPRSVVKLCLIAVVLSGCAAVVGSFQMDQRYGKPHVIERTLAASAAETDSVPEFYRDIKPIVDRRCVVCHGCYDAPCQLKMTSFGSIDRGASKQKVYDGTRLLAANLTRLSIDAGTTEEWRGEGFFPVLNERRQTLEANREGSLIYRMLELKQAHPLPQVDVLPDSFDFSLDRDQQCAKIEEFDSFAQDKPLWGMPYGLPAIPASERETIERWVETGARARFPGIKPTTHALEIDRWEHFLNGRSLKQQLVSRYIYEHLFLADLYFDEASSTPGQQPEFFKLVRSRTAPGRAIDVIASRRPFDDPNGNFYYRLQRVKTTTLAKLHMPYKLDRARMQRWRELFYKVDYNVTELPGYDPEVASNPFITFIQLPLRSRYEFMLDEAQFTIMGFIKGPVCRGQVALNVINDHFWVLFVDPKQMDEEAAEFLAKERKYLRLPAAEESNELTPLTSWLSYSKDEHQYMQAKKAELRRRFDQGMRLGLNSLWDGDGHNRNAALTIFRHFDSASVVKGLVGDTPKTAWVIGYPLLERLHYLLVAGFDVFGNVGHQLLTRLYMDFLRMDGEYNFLLFLPRDTASKELDFWYRGEEDAVVRYLKDLHSRNYETSAIRYKTDNPKKEFFNLVKARFGSDVIAPDPINSRPAPPVTAAYQRQLQRLAHVHGVSLEQMPEQSLMQLQLNNGRRELVSLIRNRSHSNVAQLFGEKRREIPEEQTLSVTESVIGAYPNAFFKVTENTLPDFVDRVAKLNSERDYARLMSTYGVRRTNSQFWQFSDNIQNEYMRANPIEGGVLDYNRLENR